MTAALPAVWVNGERQPAGEARVSASDRGFTLADGVFETMRVAGGVVFRLDRHLARLHRALEALEIGPVPDVQAFVVDAVRDAVREADVAAAAVRLTVTRGVGAGVAPPAAAVAPTVVVAVQPFPEFPARVYADGLTAHVASGRRNERAMTAGLKTLAYTDAVAALIEARRAGADEALFLDTEGHCAEASASNLLAIMRGRLITPPVTCGALPGITRATVLELAHALGIPADERAFGPDELLEADEALLTSSLRGVAPLVRVGGCGIGVGAPGPVTRALADAYAALVGRECAIGPAAEAGA
ncbi:MAG TPA: aminotransferase class IV [Gemmatirosa sp.]